jgi:hypothetical protein
MRKTNESELERIARLGRTTLNETGERTDGRRVNIPLDQNDATNTEEGANMRGVIWRWQVRRRRR